MYLCIKLQYQQKSKMPRTLKILAILIVSCQLSIVNLNAQEISGYISGMPSLIFQPLSHIDAGQMLTHNRLNFGWQMNEHWRVDAGMRNRFIIGDLYSDPKSIKFDAGLMNLSWNWLDAQKRWTRQVDTNITAHYSVNFLGNTAFDRLNLTFEKNNWKLQLGRQRINWGQTFVWNPNDIFNTYSFFDFDYPERPGCDAFRGTFFHNATSSSELAVSVNHENKITSALLHRWNKNNVDYQLIAGQQTQTDFVAGGAITTDFRGLNIRSELSYFHPMQNITDTGGIVAVSVGADYIFSNSLMLQTEVLYNNADRTFHNSVPMGLYGTPLSAKQLSISDWTIFANVSYPITPRLNGGLSSMYFVDIKSCYVGISLDFSVAENLDFSFITQYFSAFSNSQIGAMQLFLGFVRLKYTF